MVRGLRRAPGRDGGGASEQGSGESVSEGLAVTTITQFQMEQEQIYASYNEMVNIEGIAKEVARLNTPVSRYSKMRAKTDLRNWLGFLMLRMAPNAQWEIRQYAQAVAEMVKAIWPRTYALFEEHDLHGAHLSRTEANVVREMLKAPAYGRLRKEGTDEEYKALASLSKKLGL